MDNDKLSLYLSRILAGSYHFIHNNNYYKIIYPDISIKYKAEIFANNIYFSNRFNDWIQDDDIVHYLVMSGIWDYSGDQNLIKIEKQIEDYKVDLYNNHLNPTRTKSIRRSLDSQRRLYDKMYSIRHSFDHLTVKGYANILKNQYIIAHSIYKEDGAALFDPEDPNLDLDLLNSIAEHISLDTIDIPTFKRIARSDLWRNYWSANKDFIFGKPAVDWTDEQRTLVILTRMYDSAYENPDCPPDNIVNDDDMFEGWMISQRKENEKARAKNRAEKMFGGKGLAKAQEVFVMANSKEEAQSIYNLNDSSSHHIIKERNSVIMEAKKDIKESELPDVQRNLITQQNKNFIQSRKGHK